MGVCYYNYVFQFKFNFTCACMDTLQHKCTLHCYIKVLAMTYYVVVKVKENTPMKIVIVTKRNYYKVK